MSLLVRPTDLTLVGWQEQLYLHPATRCTEHWARDETESLGYPTLRELIHEDGADGVVNLG